MFKADQIVQLINSGEPEATREVEIYGCIKNDVLIRVDGQMLTFDKNTWICRDYDWLTIKPLEPILGACTRIAALWTSSTNPDMTDKEFRDLATTELPSILHELNKDINC